MSKEGQSCPELPKDGQQSDPAFDIAALSSPILIIAVNDSEIIETKIDVPIRSDPPSPKNDTSTYPAKVIDDGNPATSHENLTANKRLQPASVSQRLPPIPSTAAAIATANMLASSSPNLFKKSVSFLNVGTAHPPLPVKKRAETVKRPDSLTIQPYARSSSQISRGGSNVKISTTNGSQIIASQSWAVSGNKSTGSSPPPSVRKIGSQASIAQPRIRASSALSLASINAEELALAHSQVVTSTAQNGHNASFSGEAATAASPSLSKKMSVVSGQTTSTMAEERSSDTVPATMVNVGNRSKKNSKKSLKASNSIRDSANKNVETNTTPTAGSDKPRQKVENHDTYQKSQENLKLQHLNEQFAIDYPGAIGGDNEGSINEEVFGVGVAAAIANAEALNGLASPSTLTFYDPEMESGYRDYFAIYYIAMWRKALALILGVGWGVFVYHMLIYPADSDFYISLSAIRTKAFPEGSWRSKQCLPGFVCVPCVSGHLCNVFNPILESVFFGGGFLVPTMALFIASYKLGPGSAFNVYTHSLAITYMVVLVSIPVSLRHYYIEPTITPYKTVLLYIFILFSASVLFRVRFIHLFTAFPVYIAAYATEAALTSIKHRSGDSTGFGIGIMLLVSSFLVILMGSYDFERNARAQYVQTRCVVQANEKLVSQLTSINTNFSDRIGELDTPLEKAIGLINIMRSDPKLSRHHMDGFGMLLALLNSNNLMAPDIENDPGRLARDEEEEAYLFSNLYRARPKTKQRLSQGVIEKSPSKQISSGEDRRQSRVISARIRAPSNASASNDSKSSAMSIPSLFLSSVSAKNSFSAASPDLEADDSDQTDSVTSSRSVVSWGLRRLSTKNRDSLTPDRKPKGFDNTAYIAMQDSKRNSLLPNQGSASLNVSPATVRRPSHGSNLSTAGSFSAQGVNNHNVSIIVDENHHKSSASLTVPKPTLGNPFMNDKTSESDTSLDFESMINLNTHLQMVSLLEKVDQWNWDIFDVHELSEHRALFTLSHYLFLRNNLYNKFQIHTDTFLQFAAEIEAGYHADVPYHNSVHGADVLHGVNYFRNACANAIEFTDMELLILFTAAMIHDFKNNNFLVNTSDQLALLYNDRSILENHHVSTAFRVLLQPECNFVAKLSKEEYKEFRDTIIELVLATDLQAQHFSILSMFKNKVSLTNSFDPVKVHEDRTLLFKMMIKCAGRVSSSSIFFVPLIPLIPQFPSKKDVSNPTKAWPLYEKWTGLVLEEFFTQGDAEKALGIPVSPYYDRDTIPLFEAFNMYVDISTPVEGIINNRAYWLLQVQKKNAAEAEATAAATAATTPVPLNGSTPNDMARSNRSVNVLNGSDAVAIAMPAVEKDAATNSQPEKREPVNWRSLKVMLRKDMKDKKHTSAAPMPLAGPGSTTSPVQSVGTSIGKMTPSSALGGSMTKLAKSPSGAP
ncbi:hypothetical protein CcCBS67573_g06106 [Chytriomyces confervae]|uniref:PDEase domain-containing protein n=1 Tax=Chytriomyces confervae TaxID=246404 RepID=A0A507F8C7_9FUNG|nr:hypothetical protein CcCBS67573_g06106 [Chytriomyces confervae]